MTELLVASPLRLCLHWDDGRLRAIDLEWSAPEDVAQPRTAHGIVLQELLLRYVEGVPVLWPELPLAHDAVTPFRWRVLQTLCSRAVYGTTVTYAQLAALAGSPKAARAVGGAMAHNPWPLVVPCHRVLAVNGPGGFSGAGLPMKAWLLRREGISVPHDLLAACAHDGDSMRAESD